MTVPRALAEIKLSALRHNLSLIKRLGHHCKIMAMVKSNAYGHGLVEVAMALKAADGFGVHCINEALVLRNAGFQHPITIMTGFIDKTELGVIEKFHLQPVIHRPEQIEVIAHSYLKSMISVWLKIDTGMHRLGFLPEQVPIAYQRLYEIPSIRKPFGLMTHLANADEVNSDVTKKQLKLFNAVTQGLDGIKSIAHSAGILGWPETITGWLRPGLALYGISPFPDRTGKQESLEPVMTLSSLLVSIKQLKSGDAVGYGGTWVCPEDMPIGIVAIGYGDGYPRHIKNGTPVLIHKIECPIVGRVSMDMLAVDLRPCQQANVGDKVILWGEDLPIERIARAADTIPYELLCQLTTRVKKVYVLS